VSAWLSVLGDRWDCNRCSRTGFVCSRAGHMATDSELERRLAEAPVPASVPAVFRAEAALVCPRVMVGPLAQCVADAYGWFEKGNLGVTFLEAPLWLGQALARFGSELMKAITFKAKQNRPEKR
jgi:hypothetical protein